jgi:hypothetical protein
MNTTNDKKSIRSRRKSTIIIATLAVLALICALAVGPMVLSTDGTEQYTGVKLEAAKNVLAFDRGSYSPALFSSMTRQHVENVTESAQGKDNQGNPLRCTDDPNTMQYYSVTVRRIWLFGTT